MRLHLHLHEDIDVKLFQRRLPLEYEVPLHQLHLTMISDAEIHYKFSAENYKIHQEKENKKNIYFMKRQNIPAKQISKYTPYWYYPFDFLQIGLKIDWADVANYISQCFTIVPIDEKLITQFKDEKNQETTPEKIVLSILNFINKNIRYFSNSNLGHSIIPAHPNDIWQRSYGDCKDFVNFFRNMLAIFNIESWPVLIDTQYGKKLKELLPSAGLFNHVILMVKLNKIIYFIDPTIRQNISELKYLYLPNYGDGLVCNEDTKSLVSITNKYSCANKLSFSDTYDCKSLDQNQFIFKSTATLSGLHALRLKQSIEAQGENKFWENVQNFYKQYMEIHETLKTKVDGLQALNNRMSYTLSYRVSLTKIAKQDDKYFIRLLPMDLLEHTCYGVPLNPESDFFYGESLEIDYSINLPEQRELTITYGDISSINDDAFNLVKIGVDRNDVVSHNYQFKKYGKVIAYKHYREFFQNILRLEEALPAFFTISKKTFWSRFINAKVIEYILYASIVTSFLVSYFYPYFKQY